ncbi:MAG: ethyl tert-butyl ether degradation protein EthD [Solirubrobacterales bacterium]|jgi:uncharacterized protein (TIGR02118 family)|nr:ethyl tert-butyl ether degradation protein EthD [Solirubrobacterales bacterium]
MIRVSVMYPSGDGSTFDHDYYRERHMPLVAELMGDALKGTAIDRGLAGGAPGEPPTYVTVGHMTFDAVEDFQAGMAEHGEQILGDIPNYTNITPVLQINEIVS